EAKPVTARGQWLGQRRDKWSRRHMTVVRAAFVVLLLAPAALAVSTALIWQAKEDLAKVLARELHSLERERQASYYQRIALAERKWSANNLSRAEPLLDAFPADVRGW